MNDLRIVFMGTPEFAVPSLEILVENNFSVVGVVTAPDKPSGRGLSLTQSPVKSAALNFGLNVLQPTNLKSPDFQNELRALGANLAVVVAFRMLPESVWQMPSLGTFNLHASLLPQYRGAAPINWAVINGEAETGVTTFFLQHEIDTGSVIFQEKEKISDDDTAGTVYERLMNLGAALVLKTVSAIQNGSYPSVPQSNSAPVRHAPKIFKETCRINWDQPRTDVRNFIRGLSPYPAAWTTIGTRTFKIFSASFDTYQKDGAPGDFSTDNKSYLYMRCSDGWLSIGEFQAEGKKRMAIADFFKGNKF